ncbi:putative phosphoglycerate mutase pmu1 [Ciborinia camelliae]|nr:putative phosphoglycerate mutase pmu1 [Ciborinia camelliae]
MNNKVQSKVRHMEFRNVVGYFLQDDQNTDSETFNYTVRKNICNHAVGPHINMTCYWSHLDGDANSTWADSQLAPTGVAQALVANDFWGKLITTQNISPPQSYYVSPLTRCLETCSLTFNNLSLPPSSPPFVPIIKELLREGISSHTCDRRRSKTYIHALFPNWKFESKFPEEDPYWRANYSETQEAENRRFKTLLDDLFMNDNSTFISLSSHSGAINTILRVIGHRTFSLKTGAVIPVLVKGQSVLGEDPNPIYKGPEYTEDPKICPAPPSLTETPIPVNNIGLQKPGDFIPPPPPAAPKPTAPAEPNRLTDSLSPSEPNSPTNPVPPTEPMNP